MGTNDEGKKENQVQPKISAVQFGLIEASIIDITSDLFFTIAVWRHPVFGILSLLLFMISITCNVYVVYQVLTLKQRKKFVEEEFVKGELHFDIEQVTDKSKGLSALIILLAVTSPDLLSLLPYKNMDPKTKADGFPTKRAQELVAGAKSLEDWPQLAIQIVYATVLHMRTNGLTWFSLAASGVCILYRCIVDGFVAVEDGSFPIVAGLVALCAIDNERDEDKRRGPQRQNSGLKKEGRISKFLARVSKFFGGGGDGSDSSPRAEKDYGPDPANAEPAVEISVVRTERPGLAAKQGTVKEFDSL